MKHQRILDRKLVAACKLSLIKESARRLDGGMDNYVCNSLELLRQWRYSPEEKAFMALFDDGSVPGVDQIDTGLFGTAFNPNNREARLTAIALFYTIIKEEKP